eukprot:366308-Chlamydomonas_euryale.AAC.5
MRCPLDLWTLREYQLAAACCARTPSRRLLRLLRRFVEPGHSVAKVWTLGEYHMAAACCGVLQ